MSLNAKLLLANSLLIVAVLIGAQKYYAHVHRTPVFVAREEISLTIIPGWNLRDVADYLVEQQVVSTTAQVFAVTGQPAKVGNKEGYLAPETVRFFKDATVKEIIEKFYSLRTDQFTASTTAQLAVKKISLAELVTMASIVEREARTDADRRMVADILWRRIAEGWSLQVDSSVHYAVDKTGDVFTTDKERDSNSPWNTYKFAGLPPGPICNPSLESIEATLNPTKNDYWYFLSGSDGKMHYAKTLDDHNYNRRKYLK